MITRQQTLATWLEEVPEALIMTSPHGEIIHANMRAQTILSLDLKKDLIIHDIFDVLDMAQDSIVRTLIRLRPSEERRLIVRYKPQPSRTFNIAMRRSNQNEYILISLREEIDLLEKFEPIQHELDTYRLLAHNIPGSAVILFDTSMRYLICDGPALSAAGYKSEDFLGKTLQEALPDSVETLEPIYRRALEGEAHEAMIYASRGGVYETAVLPLKDHHDEVVGGMLFILDVTSRHQLLNTIDILLTNHGTYRQVLQAIALLLETSNASPHPLSKVLDIPSLPCEDSARTHLKHALEKRARHYASHAQIEVTADTHQLEDIHIHTSKKTLSMLIDACILHLIQNTPGTHIDPRRPKIEIHYSMEIDIVTLTFSSPQLTQPLQPFPSMGETIARAIQEENEEILSLLRLQLLVNICHYTLHVQDRELVVSIQAKDAFQFD